MSDDTKQILADASNGDAEAHSRLTPIVYDELKQVARSYMRAGAQITLQPTAVVHEAFMRLVDSELDYKSQTHFQALAAVAMRHVLVDHFRAGSREKRGGSWERVTLSGLQDDVNGDEIDPSELDTALKKLSDVDPRGARVVELRFFGGMKEKDIAAHLDVSERTVRNDWSMARAWLRCELQDDSGQQK